MSISPREQVNDCDYMGFVGLLSHITRRYNLSAAPLEYIAIVSAPRRIRTSVTRLEGGDLSN